MGNDDAEKITVMCPHCGQLRRAPACVAGQKALCPRCESSVDVPTATGKIPVSETDPVPEREAASSDVAQAIPLRDPGREQRGGGMIALGVLVLVLTFVMLLAGGSFLGEVVVLVWPLVGLLYLGLWMWWLFQAFYVIDLMRRSSKGNPE